MLLQADCAETRQSFQMSVDLIGTAESGDTWSAPLLHLLYLLRHMLHAGHFGHVLPALLRLQHNAQVCSMFTHILRNVATSFIDAVPNTLGPIC